MKKVYQELHVDLNSPKHYDSTCYAKVQRYCCSNFSYSIEKILLGIFLGVVIVGLIQSFANDESSKEHQKDLINNLFKELREIIKNDVANESNSIDKTYEIKGHGINVSLKLTSDDKHEKIMDELKKPLDDIEKGVESVDGFIGYDTILDCETEEYSNLTHHWYNNDIMIDSLLTNKFIINKSGSLRIQSLTPLDAGKYTCHLASGQEIVYKLKVQKAFQWVDQGTPELYDPSFEVFNFGTDKTKIGQFTDGANYWPGKIELASVRPVRLVMKFIEGDRYLESHKFKVLMINKKVQYEWVNAQLGALPLNALEGGHSNRDGKVYIALSADSKDLGVLLPGRGGMRYFEHNKPQLEKKYKVLVLNV